MKYYKVKYLIISIFALFILINGLNGMKKQTVIKQTTNELVSSISIYDNICEDDNLYDADDDTEDHNRKDFFGSYAIPSLISQPFAKYSISLNHDLPQSPDYLAFKLSLIPLRI